ncbi:unnamed protein product [Agarophyton chilense]
MSDQLSPQPFPASRLRTPLPSLPQHIWAHILSFLNTPTALSSAAQTSPVWHTEITSPQFNNVWRRVWDLQSNLSSTSLLNTPWNLLSSSWRQQVSASYHLECFATPHSLAHRARLVFVPPRYQSDGTLFEEDRLAGVTCSFDVLDVFGRAIVVQAFAESVLIAFECGIALIRRNRQTNRSGRKTATSSLSHPSLYYDVSSSVQGIIRFSEPLKSTPSLLAITSSTILCINIHPNKYKAISYAVLDTFLLQHGLPTTVSSSTDDKYALVGFDRGIIKIIEIEQPSHTQTLSMRESVDILVANQKYVIASSSIQPISLSIWTISNGTCIHTFTETSDGWQSINTIAAIQPLTNVNRVLVWNGLNKIFVLNVTMGVLLFGIDVDTRVGREVGGVVEEVQYGVGIGTGSPQTGTCNLALLADENSVALATSDGVCIVSISMRCRKAPKQFHSARRALLALSTDDRVLVTAEGKVFGSLGMQVSCRALLATSPRLQVWNVDKEKLSSEIELPSAATSLSVCADVVAVVCGAVGKALIVFAGGL